MKIAIASPVYPVSITAALQDMVRLTEEAAAKDASIICFPETFIPGYPLKTDGPYQAPDQKELTAALDVACKTALQHKIAIILPMDWYSESGLQNVAQVISASGELLGFQAKVQLDPSEDHIWVPGTERRLFETGGLKFGISICHEGFRYPETVRWAAVNGAHIVFHPHFAGSDFAGKLPEHWGSMEQPYYEKAMMMRALENTIYFASANYTTKFPESASSIIAPDGGLMAHQPYGLPGVLVAEIDLSKATGFLAKRWKRG